MALTLVTAPAAEPLTLAEAKDQLRVDHSVEDDLITALIVAARQKAETITRRAFVTQTWDLTLDKFPVWCNGPIEVPLGQLQSVDSFTFIDADGTTQTLDDALYKVDTVSEPGRIVPVYGQSWPVTRCEINAVTIRFTAGYGEAGVVPQIIKQAMLLMICFWYENREDTDKMPGLARDLLVSQKIWGF